ncbi:hypothetical protein [Arthrobacter oryzae]|jgi:hypothetical protein|uniref:hypothetical protein n=1 Tax=Arthrobacter oryzae TaxID=409290 RepID=UPI00278690D1|nr:hypothetical protein [Arthrobacter oryzae]MDQ0078987.1 hypothetical protein [Arthrobacter oryzae]
MSISFEPRPLALGEDVLVDNITGEYIHCGEAMKAPDSEVEGIFDTASTERQIPGASLRAYLRTRVRRCACGFQIELPSQQSATGPRKPSPDLSQL